MAAWLLLVLSGAAAVASGTALARAHEQQPRVSAPVTAATPTYTSDEAAAATSKICVAWWSASEAMNAAANVVIDTPVGWDNLVRQQARAREADVALTETAYLKNQIDQATPVEVRRLLDQYNALTFAKLDASVHRLGSQVDALIAQQNSVMRDIDAVCEK